MDNQTPAHRSLEQTALALAYPASRPLAAREHNAPVASDPIGSKYTLSGRAREIARMRPNGRRVIEEFELDRFEVEAPRNRSGVQLKACRDIIGDPA